MQILHNKPHGGDADAMNQARCLRCMAIPSIMKDMADRMEVFANEINTLLVKGFRVAVVSPEGAIRKRVHKKSLQDRILDDAAWIGLAVRSEEHTSELQSLMRITYAGFCLTKQQ